MREEDLPNYPTATRKPGHVKRSNASGALNRTLDQSYEMSQLGMAFEMLQYAKSIMLNPHASLQEMEMARSLEDRAYDMMRPEQNQKALPYGVDYQTGMQAGPYSMGVTHDKYNDELLAKMNPAYWGMMQSMQSPETAEIYKNSNKAERTAQDYLNSLNRDYRQPATFKSDPVTGERKEMIWAPNQQEIANRKQQYEDNLPPWFK